MIKPWVEKYRVTDLDKLQDQPTPIKIARGLIARGLPMNLIFVGPPGTGKTTLAKMIIKNILGTAESANSLETNASEEVRMDFVRNELKDFVFQISINGKIKIVLMEESDNIPSDPQQALRRLIEQAHRTTRFIFTCNYLSNIIPAIRSRCMIVRFKKVTKIGGEKIVMDIIENEKLEFKTDINKFISELHIATNGDMRSMINTLQSCDLERPIESVREMLGIIKPIILRSLFSMVSKGNFVKIVEKLNVMNKISPRHFLIQFGNNLIKNIIDTELLSKICKLIADYDHRLTVAGNQEVQLMGFLAKLCIILGTDK